MTTLKIINKEFRPGFKLVSIEEEKPLTSIIFIDLDKREDVEMLNPSAIARKLGVTPQYAGRVLRGKQSGAKLKERILKLFRAA